MYENSDNTSSDLEFKYCEKATKFFEKQFFDITEYFVTSKLSQRIFKIFFGLLKIF